MSKVKSLSVLVCLLAAANAWAVPFKDDFNRANGTVGNGWTILTNGTVASNIVNNEVLVAGTEATDWARCGLQRTVVGETKASCDAKWDSAFNFHFQIAAQGSSAYLEVYTWPGGALQYANSTDGGWPAAGWVAFTNAANAQTTAGQYNNIVLQVLPGGKIAVTLNGKLVDTITNAGFASTIRQITIGSDAAAGTAGNIHIDNVVIGTFVAGLAGNPTPADGATDVPNDVTLSWTPGAFAATHNVYLGKTFADANTADVTKAVSTGQAAASYKVATPLQYGQTYYWRVDEVNAAPSNTVFKGTVYSFTVEPYSYPITAITATASSAVATSPAQNTVNGSGLANGLHGVDGATMWTSDGKTTPNWIQFQFDATYKLDKMLVWNSNQMIESLVGFGAKDVKVEYSTDGTTWQTLANAPQFARAPGQANYAANTTVDFAGIQAKFVKLTINSTWGGTNMAGLSEVQFSYIPVVARLPQPSNNATGVSLSASLDWRPGRDVKSEKVYLGTDKTAVTNGTVAPVTLTSHGFAPAGLLYGTLYYWKVDEVGATTTYPGSVWSFTTQEWSVVDDFESYNDGTYRIYDAWLDGLGGNGTCSTVGNTPTQAQLDAGAHFAETVIINGGRQSMPLDCNNVTKPYYSEATRTFDTPLDWTVGGATTLALSFRGYPAQTAFTVNADATGTSMSVTGDGTDIWNANDDFSFVYKSLTGDGSIVARVTDKGTGTNTWAKGGGMIRQSLTGDSVFAAMVLSANSDGTAGNGYSFQRRLTKGANDTSEDGTAPAINVPYYVKIQRAGNSFSAWVSADGKTWRQHGTTQTIAMTNPVYLGICVTAHQAGENRTMKFDNIAATGTVTGSWQGAVVNSPVYNVAAPLYVTVEDKAGKKKTVVNPDASAVLKGTWTQWKIALSDLSGINLAAVKKLTIGVGDTANPKATGDDKLFIDDIVLGKQASLVNLVTNGGFETGALAPWGSYGALVNISVVSACTGANVPEGPIEGKYCLDVKVTGAGTNFWDAGFNMSPLPSFVKGTKYTFSAFLKVKSGTGKVNMKPEHAGGNYEGFGESQFTITEKWAEYHVTTPVFTADYTPTSLTFHVAFQAQEFWVDNVKFYVGDYVPSN